MNSLPASSARVTPVAPAVSRPALPRHSLSARLLWLTVAAVLVTEVLVFLPSLGRARHEWLVAHVVQAHIAALSIRAAPPEAVTPAMRTELLRLAGAEMIRMRAADGTAVALDTGMTPMPEREIDLRTETSLASIGGALAELGHDADGLVLVTAATTLQPDTVITVLLQRRLLATHLRVYARVLLGLSLITAGLTGALVYLSVLAFLVRPMQRITGSIAAFRADPERSAPLDAERLTLMPDDEIALAGRELAAMQRELRAALWRNARLAALGTAVAKVSHDLRGILSPALLSADRLQDSADPAVRRAGDVVADSVLRATDMVRRTLDFARDGPPALGLTRMALAHLVEEVAGLVQPAAPGFLIDNRVAPALEIEADRDQLSRVLTNLLRNAAEAGAGAAWVSAAPAQNAAGHTTTLVIEVGDNGPGLTDAVRATLFRPFAGNGRRGGTGLGLAIVRDLMRAHGGDVVLADTGPGGTVFHLSLPRMERRLG